MRRNASAITLLAVCGLPASLAVAQQFRPHCYLWDPPSNASYVMPAEFTPMVRVALDDYTTPADAVDNASFTRGNAIPPGVGVADLISAYN